MGAMGAMGAMLRAMSACTTSPPRQRQRQRQRRRPVAASSDDGTTTTTEVSYEIPYDVVKKTPTYELRVYGAYTVCATIYENRERGIATLMEYIEGGNAERAMYAPTQPLTTRYSKDGKTMELALLGRRARESIAAPNVDSEVKVVATGGELLAAIEFMGVATPEVAEYHRATLTDALAADGLRAVDDGSFRLNTFGPLYSLKPRKNELLVAVNV